MENALMIFWTVTAVSLAIGSVKAIVGLVRAPEGYENQDGFHYSR